MINRQQLLSDLQSVLRKLEADLLERTNSAEVPEVGEWLRAEYQKAKDAERTAQPYKQWLDDFITQVAAAWVLSCVFARFLEDNELVDPPRIAGPGERLEQARDEHTLFIQRTDRAKLVELTVREYLLDIFEGLSKFPAGTDVFGPHNPMNALPDWLGPDAAGELLRFFQKIDSDSGELVHDFTDPDWDTRFLGDLYQDLSEAARKKYALLQTPDFVEEFILDRTLEPALDEFGLEPGSAQRSEVSGQEERAASRSATVDRYFKMIDPACGSGHFLLGTFPRILDRWQKKEPGANIRELVQRTLDSIHGVDINPFAIAIARFRLLLSALKACGIKRLKDAPAFDLNLACGDSLYHGRQRQQMLGDWTDESHYFRSEDADHLRRILREETFHAVVANPPYIVPKDQAANQAYRRLYPTCHRQYALVVPFMERVFRLCIRSPNGAGYSGQITGNNFMKREFGKRLVEDFFKTVELSHVIDTQLAHIPDHGIPTVTIFGRNRQQLSKTVRLVGAIKREDEEPSDPAQGLVWRAIVDHIDEVGYCGEFVSISDAARESFYQHPWSIGGGGAAELKELIDEAGSALLRSKIEEVGSSVVTREDEVYQTGRSTALRSQIPSAQILPMIDGQHIRDWQLYGYDYGIWPYDADTFEPRLSVPLQRRLWPYRTQLSDRVAFGKTQLEHGKQWFEYSMFFKNRLRGDCRIAQAEVSTHNHFTLDDQRNVFNRTAPVIKLPADSTIADHFNLLAVLNSSIVCFWLKQVSHCKGGGGIGGGIAAEPWERFYAINAKKVLDCPLPETNPCEVASTIHSLGKLLDLQRSKIAGIAGSVRSSIDTTRRAYLETEGQMIRLQEDLDWECYRLYSLLDEDLTYQSNSFGIQLGERAFEIVMARKMAAGELTTTWFERHGSTPITELPHHWPDEYKALVNRRMEVIESNANIALIEQPEYKRRWNTEPWDSQVERSLRSWLLDRLESYFDFDGRMNDDGRPTAKIDIGLTSVAKLADIARQDEQLMEVAEVYRDDPAFDVQRLVEELVQSEHVPLLPILRYKPNGLRNRSEWEKTWELQRLEDKLRAGDSVKLNDYELTEKQREDITRWETETPAKQRADDRGLDAIMAIPVPPKYKSSDFISSGGARYWSLRGKLDVPKECWVSFPHCEGPDGTLMIAWAGYNHLQLAQAISAYYVDVQERLGGRDDPRLIPLLAGVIELMPWLKQWHHEIDPEYNQRMDEVYEGFITEEAKGLNLTIEEIKAWEPPKKTSGKKRRIKS